MSFDTILHGDKAKNNAAYWEARAKLPVAITLITTPHSVKANTLRYAMIASHDFGDLQLTQAHCKKVEGLIHTAVRHLAPQ